MTGTTIRTSSGWPRIEQLRHYALHLSKVVGAFAEPREREELLRRRLPDVLLFGVKLWTVMGSRLPDEVFPDLTAPRRLGAAQRGRELVETPLGG